MTGGVVMHEVKAMLTVLRWHVIETTPVGVNVIAAFDLETDAHAFAAIKHLAGATAEFTVHPDPGYPEEPALYQPRVMWRTVGRVLHRPADVTEELSGWDA